MSTYSEMLENPRWQKKRLSVLEAAGFKCEQCGSADKTLHVHHLYYAKGKKPWEYPDCLLRCLCKDCHATAEALRDALVIGAGSLPQYKLVQVIGYVRGLLLDEGAVPDIYVDGVDEARGIADAFGATQFDVEVATGADGMLKKTELIARLDVVAKAR